MAHRKNRDIPVKALRPFGTTIFSEMTALAEAHHAVNLSQGFPDFEGPEEIRKRAAEAILRGPNQYAPSMGIPIFRQAVAHKMKRFYDIQLDPDEEITVTAGATEGLCATLLAILEPGDEVILLEPTYDSYPPLIALARARARYVSLEGPRFDLPREALAKAFNRKTKAIIINNPQNPCGKVFGEEELSFIAQLCKEHHVYAVGDEVYEHLVYDGRKHVSLLSVPEFREQSFVVSSTAKTFSMTGWKQGYVLAAPSLSRAVRMSHQFITFCGQSGLQEAMAFAMAFPDDYYTSLLSDYARKRDWLCSALKDLGFQILKPQGTYYCVVDISPLGFDDDFAFAKMLPEKAGVAVIPCSAFWFNRRSGRNWIRFCFCKKDKTLHAAIERLRNWL
jgi:N-succinyldiaminopimelate aminotransferase